MEKLVYLFRRSVLERDPYAFNDSSQNVSSTSSLRRRPFFCFFCGVVVGFLMLMGATAAKIKFDPMTHNYSTVSQQNWMGKVTAFRNRHVFAVLFFKDDCVECQKVIDNSFNEFAKKMSGIVNVLAVNCSENMKLCKEQNITQYPSVIVYPLMPQPQIAYQGKLEANALSAFCERFVPSSLIVPKNMKDLRTAQANTPLIPKLLIISDKKTPSLLFKAISNNFKENIHMLYLEAEQFPEVVTKYNVTRYPHILVTRKNAKDEVYKGELRHEPLFAWVNIFSETFAKGGGFSDSKAKAEPSAETHPWRFQAIPELNKLSSTDLCFKKTMKVLCVIYLKEGNELSSNELEMLEALKTEYEGVKGFDFRWMWMNIAVEQNFKQLFTVKDLPSVVVFNPHLKSRFTELEPGLQANKTTIKTLLEKITQGNARYKVVPSGKMPTWTDVKAPGKQAAAKDEL